MPHHDGLEKEWAGFPQGRAIRSTQELSDASKPRDPGAGRVTRQPELLHLLSATPVSGRPVDPQLSAEIAALKQRRAEFLQEILLAERERASMQVEQGGKVALAHAVPAAVVGLAMAFGALAAVRSSGGMSLVFLGLVVMLVWPLGARLWAGR